MLGTRSVSIFAVQFAKQMGGKVIITGSGDEKLRRAQALGIYYAATPNWDEEVQALTAGEGADMAPELEAETLSQSRRAFASVVEAKSTFRRGAQFRGDASKILEAQPR